MDGYFHGPIKIMVLLLWMRPTSMLWKNWVEESGADFCVKQAMLSIYNKKGRQIAIPGV
jgi:hypothetical protein